MKIRNLVIISILVLSVFLVACQNADEAVAGQAYAVTYSGALMVGSCERSGDQNTDPFVRGNTTYVTTRGVSYTKLDRCSSAQKMIKVLCQSNATGVYIVNQMITCDNGCDSTLGTCRQSAVTCTDSDGADYTRKGTVSYNGITYTDTCGSTTLVTEYTCVNNVNKKVVKSCRTLYGNNSKCVDGACTVPSTCTDSDGGQNALVKGAVNNDASMTDICEGTIGVQEWYCDASIGNLPNDRSLDCPAGTSCTDGACVAACQNISLGLGCHAANPNKVINMVRDSCTSVYYNETIMDCSISGQTCGYVSGVAGCYPYCEDLTPLSKSCVGYYVGAYTLVNLTFTDNCITPYDRIPVFQYTKRCPTGTTCQNGACVGPACTAINMTYACVDNVAINTTTTSCGVEYGRNNCSTTYPPRTCYSGQDYAYCG